MHQAGIWRFANIALALQELPSDGIPIVRNGLMASLGLPAGTIRNIIMHRDIVPRAFACDYSLVSDLLGRVSASFRNLECLHGSRRKVRHGAGITQQTSVIPCLMLAACIPGMHAVCELGCLLDLTVSVSHVSHAYMIAVINAGPPGLPASQALSDIPDLPLPGSKLSPAWLQVLYYFLGKMLVLQPDAEHRFVHASEAQHPMLPPGAGLYTLRTPGLATTLVRSVSSECLRMGLISQPRLDRAQQTVANISPAGQLSSSAGEPGAPDRPGPAVPKAATLNDAMLDILNVPHPLDQLSNMASYGPDGAISRFHNPDHYSRHACLPAWSLLCPGASCHLPASGWHGCSCTVCPWSLSTLRPKQSKPLGCAPWRLRLMQSSALLAGCTMAACWLPALQPPGNVSSGKAAAG